MPHTTWDFTGPSSTSLNQRCPGWRGQTLPQGVIWGDGQDSAGTGAPGDSRSSHRAFLAPCASPDSERAAAQVSPAPGVPWAQQPHTAPCGLSLAAGTLQALCPTPWHPRASQTLLILPSGGGGRAPMCSSLGGADSPARESEP